MNESEWNSSKFSSGKDMAIGKGGSGLAKLWTGKIVASLLSYSMLAYTLLNAESGSGR
jgi:hypothetical protein